MSFKTVDLRKADQIYCFTLLLSCLKTDVAVFKNDIFLLKSFQRG